MPGPGETGGVGRGPETRDAAQTKRLLRVRSQRRVGGPERNLSRLVGAAVSIDLIGDIAARLQVEASLKVLDGAEFRICMGAMTRAGIRSVLGELSLTVDDASEMMRGLGNFVYHRLPEVRGLTTGHQVLFSDLAALHQDPETNFSPTARHLGDLAYGWDRFSYRAGVLHRRGVALAGLSVDDPAAKVRTILDCDRQFAVSLAQLAHLLELKEEGKFNFPARRGQIDVASLVRSGRKQGLLR